MQFLYHISFQPYHLPITNFHLFCITDVYFVSALVNIKLVPYVLSHGRYRLYDRYILNNCNFLITSSISADDYIFISIICAVTSGAYFYIQMVGVANWAIKNVFSSFGRWGSMAIFDSRLADCIVFSIHQDKISYNKQ